VTVSIGSGELSSAANAVNPQDNRAQTANNAQKSRMGCDKGRFMRGIPPFLFLGVEIKKQPY